MRLLKRMAMALAVLVVTAVAVHRPLLAGYARLFRVDDPAPSDALVVLAGDPGRNARAAAELYRRGVAPTVLVMRKPLVPFPDLNPAEVARLVLVRNGVPPAAIRLLPPVRAAESVRDEAGRMREYALRQPLRRVTVVAPMPQTARARRAFRGALEGTGVEVRVAAVAGGFDESNWYRSDEGLVAYFRETLFTIHDRLAY